MQDGDSLSGLPAASARHGPCADADAIQTTPLHVLRDLPNLTIHHQYRHRPDISVSYVTLLTMADDNDEVAGCNPDSCAAEPTFPFFELPRELRNLIYQKLTCDVQWPARDMFRAVMRYHTKPFLQRISRQFRDEYEDEVFRLTSLHLKIVRRHTRVSDALSGAASTLPSAVLAKVQHAVLRLRFCSDGRALAGNRHAFMLSDMY